MYYNHKVIMVEHKNEFTYITNFLICTFDLVVKRNINFTS
jgi:hypothetical protein